MRFLLIRDPYQNWGLPKGHVETAETPVEAAVREVAEETGIASVRIAGDLPCIDWYFRSHGRLIHKFCHFFLMECDRAETRPALEEGISACEWMAFEDAIRTISYDNARDVLVSAGTLLGVEAKDVG